eukprot:10137885-Karenia_brevis.AAC.1
MKATTSKFTRLKALLPRIARHDCFFSEFNFNSKHASSFAAHSDLVIIFVRPWLGLWKTFRRKFQFRAGPERMHRRGPEGGAAFI